LFLGSLVLLSAAPVWASSGPSASASAKAPVATTCSWKAKRVIRKVRRHGRVRRVVRVRRWRVCRPVPPPAPARLGVKAFEFGFTLSRQSIAAGDTIVELNNRGEDEHDLHLQQIDGGPEYEVGDTAPSTYSRLRLVTEPGQYRLWCSLLDHAELGMDTTIDVTSPGR
jgi:plastocyanin